MQNQYAGDVGDFGKFGLLKHLFCNPMWNLGVIWYLFPDEKHKNDGKFTYYSGLRDCDPELYDRLMPVANSNQKSVSLLRQVGVLPEKSEFFSDSIDFYSKFPTKQERIDARCEWLKMAERKLVNCNAIFIDPDNGLEIKSCPKTRKNSGKYAYYNEVRTLFKNKEICVIYQHFDRRQNWIEHKIKSLREEVNPLGTIFGIRFKPYSPRAYLILSNASSDKYVEQQLKSFLNGSWNNYWDHVLWLNKSSDSDVRQITLTPE